MKFRSTRGSRSHTLDQALLAGIADDGGLFVPEELPRFSPDDFSRTADITDVAEVLLRPYFDQSSLREQLSDIVRETFSFPIPLTRLPVPGADVRLLELFHGPTAAFKDVGAGFLAACLSRLDGEDGRPLTILVATSGDTGGAVAAAFNGRPGTRVVVLFPEGRVSERQRKQLTCWGDNVLSLAVQGSFDDCQAMVKAAFVDPALRNRYRFSSANSINIGRLLPQSTYYAYAGLRHLRETGNTPSFVVPTGNLGNALACVMARDMGLPIRDIVLATNANRLVGDYLAGAPWLPRASVQTLASAMDVGNPSNMERLRGMHGDADRLRGLLSAVSVDDDQIREQIRLDYEAFGFATCPHTATATWAYRHLTDERRRQDWILVATAHPAKFETIVEPLIGAAVPLPDELARILSRPSRSRTIRADLQALAAAMDSGFPVDDCGRAGDN